MGDAYTKEIDDSNRRENAIRKVILK